jgi:murein L,D-transpeptidase YafK
MKNIFILILIILILSFIMKGKSLYMPLIHKIKGRETISSITNQLQTKVLARLKTDLNKLGLNSLPDEIAIYAFKEEQLLEVYVNQDNKLHKLKSYSFTNSSGELGPKLKEGDKQIPEGIYQLEYLNPNSAYYLSMKVNYPNAFDQAKGKLEGRENLGSDIFIHGKNNTIGCIPIGDEAIEELFVLSSHAFSHRIDVVISPRDFRINPVEPEIKSVNWSDELYQNIKLKLKYT